MKDTPFISILLPTKGRANAVVGAIKSVLKQDISDCELIIVDNNIDDETRKKVLPFLKDNILYYKTGGLDMCQNWEYALSKARGIYMIVLEDKMRLYPAALSEIKNNIFRSNSDVLIWAWDVMSNEKIYRRRYKRSLRSMPSRKLVKHYVSRLILNGEDNLPRAINSCVSMSLINRIKRIGGGDDYFSLMSPDFTSAFKILSVVDRVSILDDSVGVVCIDVGSNAEYCRKTGSTKYFGSSRLDNTKMLTKNISKRLTYNTVYSDYLRVKALYSGNIAGMEMGAVKYQLVCLMDVLVLVKSGAPSELIVSELKRVLRCATVVVNAGAIAILPLRVSIMLIVKLHGIVRRECVS